MIAPSTQSRKSMGTDNGVRPSVLVLCSPEAVITVVGSAVVVSMVVVALDDNAAEQQGQRKISNTPNVMFAGRETAPLLPRQLRQLSIHSRETKRYLPGNSGQVGTSAVGVVGVVGVVGGAFKDCLGAMASCLSFDFCT